MYYSLVVYGRNLVSNIRKLNSKGHIKISSDISPVVGVKCLAIPFAFDFAFKMHIKEKSIQHSIIRQCVIMA